MSNIKFNLKTEQDNLELLGDSSVFKVHLKEKEMLRVTVLKDEKEEIIVLVADQSENINKYKFNKYGEQLI